MIASRNRSIDIVPLVGDAGQLRTGLLVLGLFSYGPLTGSARAVDDRSGGQLSRILEHGALGESAGATLLLHQVPGIAASRVLLVGLGRAEDYSDTAYRRALAAAASALADDAAADAIVALAENEVPRCTLGWRLRVAGQLLAEQGCHFGVHAPAPSRCVRVVMLLIAQALTSELVGALRQGVAIAEGVALAKEMGNLPTHPGTADLICESAQAMGWEFGFEVKILEHRHFEGLGMPAFARSVCTAGSASRIIVIGCKGRREKRRPVVFVGHGTAQGTRGAGAVLGALRAAGLLGLPVHAVGLVSTIEAASSPLPNLPRRLPLPAEPIALPGEPAHRAQLRCDVLTYAGRLAPACVIDVSTGVGACAGVLGSYASGLFANDDALASELLTCGSLAGDRVWRLPIWDDEQAGAEDPTGPAVRPRMAVNALARCARTFPWAHLDAAATATDEGETGVSTGRPVPLLAEFLMGRATRAEVQQAHRHPSSRR
ncbi:MULTISPECIES: M17 family peptidase N-terminal domain-containing protein [unclassified Chelatococcus]|uniref:M17 family peptidase N-terminal domain-containing protein n=1 Tax=unclassified Chelatococcus TaxID=2638111 RepID=UPI000311C771|nr:MULTISPECIES: M17 family peptidase N-terminal domain-containing protein [unclassified Chelatococcus]ALA19108.1 hypothetical protein AL346_18980 [Chelatococcus sp. CO-6]